MAKSSSSRSGRGQSAKKAAAKKAVSKRSVARRPTKAASKRPPPIEAETTGDSTGAIPLATAEALVYRPLNRVK